MNSKETVLILGVSGMLGSMVYKKLKSTRFNVHGTSRSGINKTIKFDCDEQDCIQRLGSIIDNIKPGYIINCIGSIPQVHPSNDEFYNRNFNFPKGIVTNFKDSILIQPSTDCVFSGEPILEREFNLYSVEDQNKNLIATDAYGRSKFLFDESYGYDCIILRGSIIGPNLIKKGGGLFDWALSNRNKEINGYTNHFWNGNTTLAVSNYIVDLIEQEKSACGVYTLGNKKIVTKYELLNLISNCFDLNIKINKVKTDKTIDRTLEIDNSLLPINRQIQDLRDWCDTQGISLC